MKVVLASYGTRGDIEPCVAVGRELVRRGHEVRMAVPPDLVAFAEAAGPEAVPYGPDLQAVLDAHRNFWSHFFRNFWKIRDLIRMRREVKEPFLQSWKEIIATLTTLADG
ncbi:glycosyltransferase, partial [Mycobacterium kyorinense]|uniref:glycosyltransferase n=1 Tax=Mycobacterium kyorinense TaxID=487514 RepID=UPI0018D46A87